MRGKHAVVIGRSDIVGKPMALLLLHRDATVTVCHSRTADLPTVARSADVLVAAIGRAGFVTRDFVKPGATVIDVGINTLETEAEVFRLFPAGSRKRAQFAEKGRVIAGDVHPERGRGGRGADAGAGRGRPPDRCDGATQYRHGSRE